MVKKQTIIAIFFILNLFLLPLALAGTLPDTGQTKCYDDTEEITCPEPGEPFYGQDAQYGPNLQSYTKLDTNGDDLPDSATEWVMVRDNITGLIWEVKQDEDDIQNYANPHDADNEYTWYDSNPATNGGDPGTHGDGTDTEDFINALNDTQFGGYDDWRMPTIKELPTIVDSSIRDIQHTSPIINRDYFPNTVSPPYWTSSTYTYYPQLAWYVGFHFGDVNRTDKSDDWYVRAVRGGQSFSNFINNENGTITDTSAGLMWEVKTDDGGSRDRDNRYTWEEALSYCENLSLADYDDWRLPNRNELQSLVDDSQHDPSVNTTYFPNTVSSQYWSSTTNVTFFQSYAWAAFFIWGSGGSYYKPYDYYVRAVRGGQCGSFGDSDGDTVCDDGDTSGAPGDNPCTGGEKLNCDDNCPNDYNPLQIDCDEDGTGDVCDNCPDDYNPHQGNNDLDDLGDICDPDDDNDEILDEEENCPNTPNPNQLDTYPPQGNGIGDACECESDFDCSGSVDSLDVEHFLWDFGRSEYNDPCTNERWCYGDFLCDGSVDAADVTVFLEDFGRSEFFNPCPPCEVGTWCVYP